MKASMEQKRRAWTSTTTAPCGVVITKVAIADGAAASWMR